MEYNKSRVIEGKSILKYIGIFLFSNIILPGIFFAIIFGNDIPYIAVIGSIWSTTLFFIVFCKREIETLFNNSISKIKSKLNTKKILFILIFGFLINVILSIFGSIMMSQEISGKNKVSNDLINDIAMYMKGNNYFTNAIMMLAIVISLGILGPIIEEVVFRGLILQALMNKMNIVMAILIESLLFSIFHSNLFQVIITFMFGILLSIVCIRFESIIASIILHIGFNMSFLLKILCTIILSKI
ncbi:CPBP family intramembrane glutamic endopeptidase [Caldicellulosiruptor naganoensis]|uniref:CPBP family intramembrane metalloprotease n=1 Tax=Caldicellulosiruptor naganoensis TaxID=29324 RepID=A0ABY7BFV6_9FIRM|nr:type II CAAX endopeptidase family protein [Caldicellulosiruptor naganoensis]WAM31713.1 CPBP family intramembrane metalloprotease [Caldicellulosiruptor naganoensis]